MRELDGEFEEVEFALASPDDRAREALEGGTLKISSWTQFGEDRRPGWGGVIRQYIEGRVLKGSMTGRWTKSVAQSVMNLSIVLP